MSMWYWGIGGDGQVVKILTNRPVCSNRFPASYIKPPRKFRSAPGGIPNPRTATLALVVPVAAAEKHLSNAYCSALAAFCTSTVRASGQASFIRASQDIGLRRSVPAYGGMLYDGLTTRPDLPAPA